MCNRTIGKHNKQVQKFCHTSLGLFSDSMKENKNVFLHNGVTFNISIYLNEAVSSLSEKSETVVELLFAGYPLTFSIPIPLMQDISPLC